MKNIKKAYKDGMLKEEEIRRSAGRLINTIERLKNAWLIIWQSVDYIKECD